jgi:hypothetical protein
MPGAPVLNVLSFSDFSHCCPALSVPPLVWLVLEGLAQTSINGKLVSLVEDHSCCTRRGIGEMVFVGGGGGDGSRIGGFTISGVASAAGQSTLASNEKRTDFLSGQASGGL